MSFQGLHARCNRLYQENAAWKMLKADNAPLVLAFLADLFDEENEIPFWTRPSRTGGHFEAVQGIRSLGNGNRCRHLSESVDSGRLTAGVGRSSE